MKNLYAILLLASFLVLMSCSSSRHIDDVDIGQSLILTEGAPEFILTAEGSYSDDGASFVRTTVEVSKGSLVFRTRDEIPKARITVRYELRRSDSSSSDGLIFAEEFTYDIEGDPERSIQTTERLRFSESFDIEPGDYILQASVKDFNSDKQVTRTTNFTLPDLDEAAGSITSINLLGTDSEGERFTIGTYDVQAVSDSLKFRFFITRSQDDDPVYAHLRLLEFESDHQPARHMADRNLPGNSIRVRGINYGRHQVLEEQTRRFDTEFGAIEIVFNIEAPESGSFRFEVFTTHQESADPSESLTYRARDFGMRPPHFPEIASARELAEPLVYLMTNSEYRRLMAIEDEDELRRAVDIFWLENLETGDKAREVMALFYERVVEANKQFSNYKAGWKTDLGMIYILFGPPWYEDIFGPYVRWVYGFDKNNPYRVFEFDRTRLGDDRHPFTNWTLRRQTFYHAVHHDRKREWLNGFVLSRPFGG
ncbi:MAG: GWxTD domain-containing protein [Balneolia bacterium]|nr:GWxTD domain-containing protein [Balneolia bacterium]